MGSGKKRIILEADARRDRNAVYDLLDDIVGSDKIPVELLTLTQVRLQLVFRGDAKRREKTITFDVTAPDLCSLKYDPKHEIAKKYLKSWGIDVSERTGPGTEKG